MSINIDSQKQAGEKIISENISGTQFLLFFIIISLSGFVLYYFQKKIIVPAENSIKEKVVELDEKEASIKSIEKLKKDFPDFPSQVAFLSEVTEKQKDPKQLISQINKIAKENKIDLLSIIPKQEKSFISATLSFKTTYEQFKNFQYTLENNRLIVEIVKIDITSNVENKDDKRLIFNVNLKAPGE